MYLVAGKTGPYSLVLFIDIVNYQCPSNLGLWELKVYVVTTTGLIGNSSSSTSVV